ncbi:helix-turn-helix transcriptional regulator [Lutibacter sp.]|uniref:helix-turn-helix domain-containing protein n=1 Tax=Lutibacter sp. TaxID=1925666 RepID=UPI0025C0EDAE|nr:helix-turn-helix transcriptional regulator [Lutibacter sp.]MCF6167784.1 helix-turn-helix domain-containing protein [Lutibacter sp.]
MNDSSYNNWYAMSDRALNATIGTFVKYHRLQQNRSQTEVANAANISRSTLSLLERGEIVTVATLIQVLRVLQLLHTMECFQVQKKVSPIALAKLEKDQRKRASGIKRNENNKSDW